MIPVITTWIERPGYSIAEDAQGRPVGVLYPLDTEIHKEEQEPLKTDSRGFKMGADLPPEIMFQSFRR